MGTTDIVKKKETSNELAYIAVNRLLLHFRFEALEKNRYLVKKNEDGINISMSTGLFMP